MKRILFIGPEANRSGAPFVLLHLINWLKANAPQFEIDVLFLSGGELESAFRESANVYVLPSIKDASLVRRGLSHLKDNYLGQRKLRVKGLPPFRRKYDVVLGNTVATLEHLEFFKRKGFRTISWLHELDYVIDFFFPPDRFSELAGAMDVFIVGSRAVRDMLERRGGEKATHVVHEFSLMGGETDTGSSDIRADLGIPDGGFVVGTCGTIEWRKGVDLFVQMGRHLAKKDSNIYLVWVGGRHPVTQAAFEQARYDIRQLGLQDRVIFTDIRRDLFEYYRAMSVFVLPSREDPFPIACLEAASCGKPIICFEKAGGMPEFVEKDAGFVVPYLDLEAAAEKIVELYSDPRLREQMGSTAAAKVRERHSISNSAPKILKIIEEIISN